MPQAEPSGGAMIKPLPKSAFDSERWRHTSLRRRMLLGLWNDDLVHEIEEQIGAQRQRSWGVPDQSSNVFKSVTTQLSVLYDSPPSVSHVEQIDGVTAAIEASGLWPLMQRFASNVIGLRECLMHATAYPDGHVVYRPVTPDFVIASADPARPDVPTALSELRLRTHPETKVTHWTWDEYDISDPANPIYRVTEATIGRTGSDLSDVYLGGSHSGGDYPYRDSSGAPFLPYVLYHAARTGDSLWDPFEGIEVVRGSLTAAVLHTFLVHSVRDASWPQRYVVGAAVQGLGLRDDDEGRRAAIQTDPASLVMLEAISDTQPVIGQWEPGADISKIAEVCSSFEVRVAESAGVSPADIQRLNSARSGYAISISNAGKREAQRRYEPQFRTGDLALVATTAKLLNAATGSAYPESGYSISYSTIPLSAEEQRQQREHIEGLLAQGLMSPIDAYIQLHPGTTREEATAQLERVRSEKGDSSTSVVLNGAQLQAATQIVSEAAAGRIPRASAVQMLVNFIGISSEQAEAVVGSVGQGFTLPPEPTPGIRLVPSENEVETPE